MEEHGWKEKYRFGIDLIDRQHQKLIGLLTRLDEAMRSGKGRQVLGTILKELVQYTQTHFAAEERIMKEHGYPGFEEHRAIHERMTQRVLDVQRQYSEGSISLSIELMKFLQDWVDKHILGTDNKYVPFLKDKGL